MRNPPDTAAESITFGVELETHVPIDSVSVGDYHSGHLVHEGIAGGRSIVAPNFRTYKWRADCDSSIRFEQGRKACEFVSPVLYGAEGVERLVEFVKFANDIDADVNASCGCHITVDINTVIGSYSEKEKALFLRKLVRLVNQHSLAIYAQTGAGRHLNSYSKPLPANGWEIANGKTVNGQVSLLGRGILNCRKVLSGSSASPNLVEFRAFAGTLNIYKILYHLGTVLGLCRRACVSKRIPPYTNPSERKPANGVEAVARLNRYLGWVDDPIGPDIAFGQFGRIYQAFELSRTKAMEMAVKFDRFYPQARFEMEAARSLDGSNS